MRGDVVSLIDEHWEVLRAAWRQDTTRKIPLASDAWHATAEEAAERGEWNLVASSGRGDFLAFEDGNFVLIRDDDDPRAAVVTDAVRRLTEEGLNLTPLLWALWPPAPRRASSCRTTSGPG